MSASSGVRVDSQLKQCRWLGLKALGGVAVKAPLGSLSVHMPALSIDSVEEMQRSSTTKERKKKGTNCHQGEGGENEKAHVKI